MTNDIYFIKLMAQAFDNVDLKSSLMRTFATIDQYAESPKFKKGYAQYKVFLSAIHDYLEVPYQPDTPPPTEVTEIINTVEKKAANEKYSTTIDIVLKKDEIFIASVPLVTDKPIHIKKVTPGNYTILLETGRLLWEGQISEKDLIWGLAFPGRLLDLAADTDISISKPSKTIQFLGNFVVIDIFPGIEHGTIKITTMKK